MRWLILLMSSVLLGACAGSIGPQTNPIGSPSPREPTAPDRIDPTPATSPGYRADLPDLGAAPELNNEVWLNTDRPLRLADLHGKVVLIDMWTFG
ncbi:MAG: hypothetical protein IAE80_28820 [Anaerolinea sp.]|nr:hypothetical protein [Anaerolinea sp.]